MTPVRSFLRPVVLLGLGVCLIVGGEALCLLGPLEHERLVHTVCHAMLYSGMALAALGATLHWVKR
jgi:hypothetical protein